MIHLSMHTDAYYGKVNEILSKAKSREKVLKTLKTIGEELKNGTFEEGLNENI